MGGRWREDEKKLLDSDPVVSFPVVSIFRRIRDRIGRPRKMEFKHIRRSSGRVCLYAGDLPDDRRAVLPFIGLSLHRHDLTHIRHDITRPMPLPDNCVDIYQAEDVMEHIEYGKLPAVLDEIHRVLKPGGLLRLSMPDYRCDVLQQRVQRDLLGAIVFDPGGGGAWDARLKRVIGGGHLWFPLYETTDALLDQSRFERCRIHWRHYYDRDGRAHLEPIDYSMGHIRRTPDHDVRVADPRRPMSLVVDCYK